LVTKQKQQKAKSLWIRHFDRNSLKLIDRKFNTRITSNAIAVFLFDYDKQRQHFKKVFVD